MAQTTMAVRVDEQTLETFKQHCAEKLGTDYYDIIRDVLVALPQGRVTIALTDEQRAAKEGLYK
ncbi:MAG: hypothetical protein ACPGF7_09425 [Pontibacterium sp.]